MRQIVAMIGIVVCGIALGQPPLEPGRGMSFHYSGPALEVFQTFETALGMGVEPKGWDKILQGAEAEKPIEVTVKGARLFDIVAAIEKTLGRRLEFEEAWPQVRFNVSAEGGQLAASPRASTANCDVVLERVEHGISRPMTWGAEGTHLGRPKIEMALNLRAYPVDERAAERLVAFKRPGLTLVHPEGKQDELSMWPEWTTSLGPFGRCVRPIHQGVPAGELTAGEYKLKGAILMAKVDPVAAQALTAADVGKTVNLGTAKVTVKSWAAGQIPMKWEVEGPKPDMVGEDPSQTPVGLLWIEARGRGKGGEILWPTGGGGGYNETRYTGESYWDSEPASVEFRALILTKGEDEVEEPFEVAFTLPPEFLGK